MIQQPQPLAVEVLPDQVKIAATPEVEAVLDGPSEEWKKARAKHIQELLHIEDWPESVPLYNPEQVVDQAQRANAILDLVLDRKMMGMHFLDFGCGDGWIAKQIADRGVAASTGYDIVQSDNWANFPDVKFMTTLDGLAPHSFDVIMLYDVVDHCEDPIKVMSDVMSLLKFDGVAYVRCHPWTSKHGAHLHKEGINRAYMQLFLTWGEIADLLGKPPMFTRPEKRPIEAYRWWFKDFEICKERMIKEPVNQFFLHPSFKTLLGTEQQLNDNELKRLLKEMECQFIDYKICPKPIR
jgi:SAM-dependent methyltransferase